MNIPKKLKIIGHTYEVVVNDTPRTRNNLAECHPQKLIIRLDTDNAEGRHESSFIHEVIEAINFDLNIGLRHHQIELLECALHQVITDNPRVFAKKGSVR